MEKEPPLLKNTEQKPSFLQRTMLRNVALAIGVAFVVDKAVLGPSLRPEGRKLLRRLVVRTWKGERVSIAKEVSGLLDYCELSINVTGEQNIPPSGPTIFVTNHTYAPLRNVGQFFRMAQTGYEARSGVADDYVREPYLIVQRGLSRRFIGRASAVFYDNVAGGSLGCEIVEIAKYKKSENGETDIIINHQGLKESAIQRIAAGGASIWMPQGREKEPEDFNFPERNGYLRRIVKAEPYVQVVPVCQIPDTSGNVKLIYGPADDVKSVLAHGGIQEFALTHIAPLRQSGL